MNQLAKLNIATKISKWLGALIDYLFHQQPNFYWAPDSRRMNVSHLHLQEDGEFKGSHIGLIPIHHKISK